MTFYDRYESLCKNAGYKPQSPKMQEITGVTSGAISKWKTLGITPKPEILAKIANFFNVSVDYLAGVETSNKQNFLLSDPEVELILKFRSLDDKKKELIEGIINEFSSLGGQYV